MGTKTPSKFLSLAYLKMLQYEGYCNKERGIDYEPYEVDQLIWEKQTALDEKLHTMFLREQEQYALHELKVKGKKYCSRCKKDKSFKEFSPDPSKKFFGLRSWCRVCRSEK
jgi:hypothetical protein